MKAANAGAAMRGASATFVVLASLAMRPDMSIPICACRYVILIEGRLQLAFLRSNVRPARSARSKFPPFALCRGAIIPRYCPLRQVMSLYRTLLAPGWNRSRMARYRVTVDTGGTFSDFVYLNEETGELSIAKLPSTPDDPSRAILVGIEALLATAGEAADIGYFCHGTTVGTNALLEGKGAKTGLLVTEGFRGIYPVGEQARPYGAAIFDVMYDKPAPLIPQSLTGEVHERVDFRGNVLQALDEAALRKTVRALAAENVESIAVCLLFSFLYPAHEARVGEIVREEIPGCDVSLSCEVLPQIREYYRLSTTVINAYLQPILARYIAALDRRLERAGVATRQKYIMQSNGGMATFAAAARRAATTVLSGPAGGVTAGVLAGRIIGLRNIITFDMGGTSCDVALIKDGAPLLASRKIEGRDLAVPMLD